MKLNFLMVQKKVSTNLPVCAFLFRNTTKEHFLIHIPAFLPNLLFF